MNFLAVVGESARGVFADARERRRVALEKSSRYLEEHASRKGLDPQQLCYVVGGSFGRSEALDASDFDLIPIFADQNMSRFFSDTGANDELRDGLREALGGMNVSRGRSVMGAMFLDDMIDPTKIGGAKDNRENLTRRMVVLTEAAQAGGTLDLATVRKRILDAYTKRMGDPHPLAFCNDVARYYRTLCIDYKAKSGGAETGWAENNVKLRHSRKLWYFATVVCTASSAASNKPESPEFTTELLAAFDLSPSERLFRGAGASASSSVGRVLDHYAAYLTFMKDPKRREELNLIPHADRYANGSLYTEMQTNSRRLHDEIMNVFRELPPEVRDRTLEWFFL